MIVDLKALIYYVDTLYRLAKKDPMINEEIKEKLLPIFNAISNNSKSLFEHRFEELIEEEIERELNAEFSKKNFLNEVKKLQDKRSDYKEDDFIRKRNAIAERFGFVGFDFDELLYLDFYNKSNKIIDADSNIESIEDDYDGFEQDIKNVKQLEKSIKYFFEKDVEEYGLQVAKDNYYRRRGEVIQSKLDGFFDVIVSHSISPEMIQNSINNYITNGTLDENTEKKSELLKVFECAVELFSLDTKKHLSNAIKNLENRKKEAVILEENQELIQKVKDRKNQPYKIAFYVRMCEGTTSYAKNLNRWCDAMGIENHGSKKVRQITLGDFIHVMNANGQIGHLDAFKLNWEKAEGYSLDIS